MKWISELLKKDNRVYVEVRGRETVLAQGYCRIELYTPERITLSNGEYSVAICGDGLELRHLSVSVMAIDGRIDGIEFL
ncbi:MAG: YabP/YqfC family sporulation protein [Clostridia bacterium]|nr:YabP/YqfC family sporulation protein [Clostridia bacterium]